MGIHLYCITSQAIQRPTGLVGVDGADVEPVEVGNLRAWVARLEVAPAPTIERLQAHNEVVDRLAASEAPVPVRFGQWFENISGLASVLDQRRPQLERALLRVRGAVEFGVRVLDPEGSAVPAPDRSSGRAYLEGLARREGALDGARHRAERLATEIREHAGSVIRAQSVRILPSGALLSVSHLVARHDTRAYAAVMTAFEEERPELRLWRSGPWPPYGFVDDVQ